MRNSIGHEENWKDLKQEATHIQIRFLEQLV